MISLQRDQAKSPTQLHAWASVLFAILLIGFLATPTAQAAIPALAKRSSKIFSAPTAASDVLLQLNRVTKVSVLSKRGGWFKVRVFLEKDFFIDGWTPKVNLFRPKRRPKPVKPPTQQDQKFLETLIDKGDKRGEVPTFKEAKSKGKIPKSRGDSFFKDRLKLGLGLGYRVNSFAVSDGASQISYDIPALFIGGNIHLKFLQTRSKRFSLGLRLEGEYEIKNYTVELFDDSSPPLEISSDSLSGSGLILDAALVADVALTNAKHPIEAALMVGYIIHNSSRGDATLNGNAINLFTTSEYTHIYGGSVITLPFVLIGIQSGLRVGAKALLSSTFSESGDSGQSNISGTNPSVGFGYTARAGFMWRIGSKLGVDLYYARRDISVDLTGAGQRISNTSQTINFTDATISESYNAAVLSITYDF